MDKVLVLVLQKILITFQLKIAYKLFGYLTINVDGQYDCVSGP